MKEDELLKLWAQYGKLHASREQAEVIIENNTNQMRVIQIKIQGVKDAKASSDETKNDVEKKKPAEGTQEVDKNAKS